METLRQFNSWVILAPLVLILVIVGLTIWEYVTSRRKEARIGRSLKKYAEANYVEESKESSPDSPSREQKTDGKLLDI